MSKRFFENVIINDNEKKQKIECNTFTNTSVKQHDEFSSSEKKTITVSVPPDCANYSKETNPLRSAGDDCDTSNTKLSCNNFEVNTVETEDPLVLSDKSEECHPPTELNCERKNSLSKDHCPTSEENTVSPSDCFFLKDKLTEKFNDALKTSSPLKESSKIGIKDPFPENLVDKIDGAGSETLNEFIHELEKDEHSSIDMQVGDSELKNSNVKEISVPSKIEETPPSKCKEVSVPNSPNHNSVTGLPKISLVNCPITSLANDSGSVKYTLKLPITSRNEESPPTKGSSVNELMEEKESKSSDSAETIECVEISIADGLSETCDAAADDINNDATEEKLGEFYKVSLMFL